MTPRCLFPALLVLTTLIQSTAHGATTDLPDLYVKTSLPSVNTVFRVSMDTFDAHQVGLVPYGSLLSMVAPGPTQTAAYTYDRVADVLFTIDLTDASIVSSVALDDDIFQNGRGLATAPDGTVYGIFRNSDLKTIDPATGVTTFVSTISGLGSSSLAGPEAMTFAPDGTLYVAAAPGNRWGRHLYTLDIPSGLLSLIGPIGSTFIDIDHLAYGPDDFLYGFDTKSGPYTELFQINPASGDRTFVGELPPAANGLVFMVPLPSAVWLATSLLIGCGLYRHVTSIRRRSEG